jgi:hypothetical protein
MEYKIKEDFAPVEVKMTLFSGRELANFNKCMQEFGQEYLDNYDEGYFAALAKQLTKIEEKKILSGEMISVE